MIPLGRQRVGDRSIVLKSIAGILLLFCFPGSKTPADEGPESSSDSLIAAIQSLPAALPNGRSLRPVLLYQSQMFELIPENYRPISVKRLQQAIDRLTDQATDDQASRLKGAVYWVDLIGDTLVSDRSVIDLDSDRDAIVRRTLGTVNLSIDQPQSRGTVAALDGVPRLESDPNGELVAVIRGGATIEKGIDFKWRLQGTASGSGTDFRLQIPRTPQTRIVLSAPTGVRVTSLDGVLRARPGPPPDAGELGTEKDVRWYEIDAGGLASVRIHVETSSHTPHTQSLIVRRSSIQYEIEPSGLTWTKRMVVQIPAKGQIPSLSLPVGSTVTSVRFNGRYRRKMRLGGQISRQSFDK